MCALRMGIASRRVAMRSRCGPVASSRSSNEKGHPKVAPKSPQFVDVSAEQRLHSARMAAQVAGHVSDATAGAQERYGGG
jgi:hypothetical protein